MKKTFLFMLTCALLLTSCGTSISGPKELVQKYFQATFKDDSVAEASLVFPFDTVGYSMIWNETIGRIKAYGKCEIQKVYEIKSLDVRGCAVSDTTVVDSVSFDNVADNVSGWIVETKVDTQTVSFLIGCLNVDNEREYKIDLDQTRYMCILSELQRRWNCDITLKPEDSYISSYDLARSAESNLMNFKYFLRCIEQNDTAAIGIVFPVLSRYDGRYPRPDKPVLQEYSASRTNEALLFCNDSVVFLMDDSNRIRNCRNVILGEDLRKAIVALGETPEEREEDMMDKEYLKALQQQKEEIERRIADAEAERERAALAARYKAQGAALVDHCFVSNSEKDSKGIEFSVANLSSKDIKYVRLTLVGYNKVDDPVWDDGYVQTITGIGPLPAGYNMKWSFDNIWTVNPSIVDSYEIKTMTIVFKSGGSKTIKLPQTLPSDWKNWLY